MMVFAMLEVPEAVSPQPGAVWPGLPGEGAPATEHPAPEQKQAVCFGVSVQRIPELANRLN